MRYTDLLEARQGSLYHAMNLEYYPDTIARDRILATSIQRYSDTGEILADPDFKYNLYRSPEKVLADPNVHNDVKTDVRKWNNSNWYLGISTTRDIKFASKWKDVVFELDYAKLSHRYKIIPWNWGSSRNKYKFEREEFIVLQKNAKEYVDSRAGPTENNPKIPLSPYLLGVYLSQRTWEIYTKNGTKEDPIIAQVQSHLLYKGLVDGS